MTLRARLILLVAGALLLSLLVGGIVIVTAASYWVQQEIDASADIARKLVDERLEEAAEEAESPGRLTELLQSLETGYHVKAAYVPAGSAATGPIPAPLDRSLLSRLLGMHPIVEHIGVAQAGLPPGEVVLSIDPEPDVAKVARAVELSATAIALFSGTTLILVALGLTRSLRPLEQLAGAFSRIGTGDYTQRVTTGGPREVAALRRQFNLMSEQLQQMQGRNRALDAQMLAVQDRERREIARDLHDELGPCLLAASLDVSALVRLSRAEDSRPVADCAAGLVSVLGRMQELVRRMIERLHLAPTDGIELSVEITNLVAFWRDRCPEIDWRVQCAGWQREPEEATALTLFKVAQEAVANAVRHSGAHRIDLACGAGAGGWLLTVADDGIGIPRTISPGMGLSGMRSRVEALGGTLVIERREAGGTLVTARVPLHVGLRDAIEDAAA